SDCACVLDLGGGRKHRPPPHILGSLPYRSLLTNRANDPSVSLLLGRFLCMVRPDHLDALPFWFVALPDCEPAREVGTVLGPHPTQVVSHPSGRPWLVGRWAAGTLTTAQAGRTSIALIGQHAETVDRLPRAPGPPDS